MLGAVKRGLLADGKEGWVFLEPRKGKSPLKLRLRRNFLKSSRNLLEAGKRGSFLGIHLHKVERREVE
jgi:hypothetical protein